MRPSPVAIELPRAKYGDKWVSLVNASFGKRVEDLACPSPHALEDAGIESCEVGKTYERMVTWRLKPGQFDLTRQMFLPANTAIIGSANPNDPRDHRRKPQVASNTYFVGTTTQPGNDYKSLYRANKPLFARGFVLNNRTAVINISVQGADVSRRSHLYTGGAAFELPGCNAALTSADGMSCDTYHGQHLGLSANGQAVHDVRIENVRINDLLFDHGTAPYYNGSRRDSAGHFLGIRATQGLFYSASKTVMLLSI